MLRVDNLQAYYGKSHILHGVDLRVGPSEIVALLGRNGTGRSTAVKAMMGMVRCTGSIRLKGEEICGLKPYQIAQKGLGYVPEAREIFPTLTVRQNLELGRKNPKLETRWSFDDMYRLFPRLRERENTPAGVMSGGEQQMLTLCRTLMGDPDVIMIDEPTEGVAPKIVQEIAELLQEVTRRGISVFLIEQKLDIALKVCNRLYVMGHGSIVFEGTAAELQENKEIRQEWLEV
jgi:branched-chain amino acid transport system ATP-binding protein